MLTEHLETQVRSLSRQDKFLLIQVLVNDLGSEEARGLQGSVMRPSGRKKASKKQAVDTFLGKWKGSLKGVDADAAKLRYLLEKYQ